METTQRTIQTAAGPITLFTITNCTGASVVLSTAGAGIVSVNVPDRNGVMADVTAGYRDVADYIGDGPCCGKIVGRYGNRIARGHLEIDGMVYRLPVNNGPNCLHGGPEGLHNRIWKGETAGDNTVVFTIVDPDGHMGFPGTLTVRVAYTWNDANELEINIRANTDKPTALNLTNHAYWNLEGHNRGSALGHLLRLNASRWLPTDSDLVPTGVLEPVSGTPMDFTDPKALGRDIRADFAALRYGKGYDNCWAVDGYDGSLRQVAELFDPVSGRVLEILSTQPGVQVYTGNWLAGSPTGKEGYAYGDYDAVAIECQHFPDSVHQGHFPDTILRPGQEFEEVIRFVFGLRP